jgi:1-deoxy-D-xylulose-5-phosphate reductoisomerase
MPKPLVVLGATGSIGTQTLEVARRLGLSVAAVAAQRATPALLEVGRAWPAAAVVIATDNAGERDRFQETLGRPVLFGPESVVEVASLTDSTVINGIVGAAGLRASVATLEAGNRLALANKESLVAGGEVVLAAAKSGGGELIPVDSEHSALFQCLVGEGADSVARLVLTASGGPFFGRDRSDLAGMTAVDALAHPTWEMGPRVTVDSATLMNKGLEVIEAHHLFGIDYDAIDVIVHRQSIVHSLVEFVDGSSKAQLGEPDMRVPIQYALTYPDRLAGTLPPLNLADRPLEFHTPDRDSFPALDLAFAAGRRGGSAPAILNAADEIAVEAFLDGRIGFLEIVEIVERTLEAVPHRELETVADVLSADGDARTMALSMISGSC